MTTKPILVLGDWQPPASDSAGVRPIRISESLIEEETHKKMRELCRGDLIISRTGKQRYLVLEDRLPEHLFLRTLSLVSNVECTINIAWQHLRRCKVYKADGSEINP